MHDKLPKLEFEDADAGSITIKWVDNYESSNHAHRIEFRALDDEWDNRKTFVVIRHPSQEYRRQCIRRLKPKTTYFIRLTATGKDGTVLISEELAVDTQAEASRVDRAAYRLMGFISSLCRPVFQKLMSFRQLKE